jgi:hypothetical protein
MVLMSNFAFGWSITTFNWSAVHSGYALRFLHWLLVISILALNWSTVHVLQRLLSLLLICGVSLAAAPVLHRMHSDHWLCMQLMFQGYRSCNETDAFAPSVVPNETEG